MKTSSLLETPALRGTNLLHWRKPWTTTLASCAAAIFCGSAFLTAGEMPKMPQPVKEHAWLQRFLGTWDNQGECYMDPAKTTKFTGSETSRKLGGFWVITEGKGEMGDMKMSSILTLGYDADKQKFIGTWVDSVSGYLWKYEGNLSEDGNTLTLETQGPCPMHDNKIMSVKEMVEFKGTEDKVFTSWIKNDDGQWNKTVVVNSHRKIAPPESVESDQANKN